MVANETGWKYVDQMRETSGGGIIRAIGETYLDTFGDFRFLFYTILLGTTMAMAYQRSHTVYAPLFILVISGSVMSALLGGLVGDLGNVLVGLSITAILFKLIWSR